MTSYAQAHFAYATMLVCVVVACVLYRLWRENRKLRADNACLTDDLRACVRKRDAAERELASTRSDLEFVKELAAYEHERAELSSGSVTVGRPAWGQKVGSC